MGSSPYGKRDLVAVTPVPGVAWKYGFPTNTTAAQRTILGQVAAITGAGGYIDNLVLGANAPKPARMKHYRSTAGADSATGGVAGGFDTSFCDVAHINDALAAGWIMVSRYKRRRGSAKYTYVTIATADPETGQVDAANAIHYAWPMPAFLRQKISGDLTGLGIKIATGNDLNLVFGARYPKPPRVTFKAVGTDGRIGHRTTFADPSKVDSLPSGWTEASSNV